MEDEYNEIRRIVKGFYNTYNEIDKKYMVLYNKMMGSSDGVHTQDYKDASVGLYSYGRMREKLDEWVRKIEGIASGYHEEFTVACKHGGKGRAVGFVRADVTVQSIKDLNTLEDGKAIQIKSTITADYNAVNTMIGKGLNQLTGETGENPATWERLQVRISIKNKMNPWPYTRTGAHTFGGYTETGAGVIQKRVNAHTKGKGGCDSQWLKNNLTDMGNINDLVIRKYNKKSRMYTDKDVELKMIMVKIIYPQKSYMINDIELPNGQKGNGRIKKIVFMIYRNSKAMDGEIRCGWHHAIVSVGELDSCIYP